MFTKRCFSSLGLIAFVATLAMAADPGYHLINTYKLGGDGGWDYLPWIALRGGFTSPAPRT